jgi:hypothetical protein
MLWINVAPGLLVLDEYSTRAVVCLGLIYGVDLLPVIMLCTSVSNKIAIFSWMLDKLPLLLYG